MNLTDIAALILAIAATPLLLVAALVLKRFATKLAPDLSPKLLAQSEHVAWISCPTKDGGFAINRLGLTADHAPRPPRPDAVN